MKKRRSIHLFILSLIALSLSAQNEKNTFDSYAKFISKNLDITWKKPKRFIDLKTFTVWGPESQNHKSAFFYHTVLQSKDSNCLIMYPDIVSLVGINLHLDETLTRNQMINDINTALDLTNKRGIISKNLDTDIKKSIKTFTDKDAKKLFNADTVFIAPIPISNAYQGKYTYCTGVYIYKAKRPPMFIKCFFNEKGKNNERQYLDMLYKTIKYRNDNWVLNEKSYPKELKEFYSQTE
ncbi:hypothetical protein [Bacteroides faecalis]|uniref:hypothetical protein n=1 Tax=Bacteroides faecalis TaxID=2447885 RepID=UPI000F6286B2|nr:hypothetical protein [Bacteroides faecalis]